MAKPVNLVIVESPAKAKTIEKILGDEYQVLSSYGHIRDLSKSEMGIHLDKNFEPDYIISEDKKKVVSDLKKAANRAEIVWLASDEDREGEAIAWHLYEVLERNGKPTKRIAFHEITPTAIKNAIQNPRNIDLDLVNAQQARRILDRIVGFELSPILWRRIKPSLSAGRVQSVALRLICERENQIHLFTPESSYTVTAIVKQQGEKESFVFDAFTDHSFSIADEAKEFMLRNREGVLQVSTIEGRSAKRTPAPPFTTSTLQQEASRKLGFSVGRTMAIAQRLYESGLITYMRTDSTNLSAFALKTAESVIKEKWGDKYHQKRSYKTKTKGAQEAHEAIRPTYMDRETISGDSASIKLYNLIRMRAIASQMSDAIFEKSTATLINSKTQDHFTAHGEVLIFEGFLKAYNDHSQEDDKKNQTSIDTKALPKLKEGDKIEVQQYIAREKYSYPPARYTEASLVRNMEELGIGRPSTYAPTIQTLFQRDYIKLGTSIGTERIYKDFVLSLKGKKEQDIVMRTRTENTGSEKGKLLPTDIGIVVNDFLIEHFPKIVDFNFTAEIEEQFDFIAEGKKPWQNLLAHFYSLFHPLVEKALEERDDNSRGARELGIEPKSGRCIIARIGRYGPIIQIGTTEDGTNEKPQYVSLPPDLSITTVTLEEALDLMKLPRIIGSFEGKEIKTNVGRFGPYIQLGNFFVSIPKDKDPLTISLKEAIELIEQKREKDERSILKTFEEDETLSIRMGRWGAYIKQGKDSYRIEKEKREKASELSYDEVLKIIVSQQKNTSSKSKKKNAQNTGTTKTPTTKRKSTTSTTKKTSTKKRTATK